MPGYKLGPAQQQLLREQVLDATQPGPVLHDFRLVLDYVGPEGVVAAGKYNLLPIAAIDALNERLSRPLLLTAMKRPLLKSHPYLQGLHLLLRASGLGRVAGVGGKARLVRDAAGLAQWEQLNPTEQYFNLLEAWLLFSRDEMVGERGSRWRKGHVFDCLQTWGTTPRNGTRFKPEQPYGVFVQGFDQHLYHLALLDLFGLMELEHLNRPIKPWNPGGLRHRPFGDALLTVLAEHYLDPKLGVPKRFRDEDEEDGTAPQFGVWQPLFQPYFPAWRANLTYPAPEPRAGIFVFRVVLGRAQRLIATPADATLDDLAGWILDSVHFDDDHLYRFEYRDRFGVTVEAHHPSMDEGPFTDEVELGTLPLEPGHTMLFEFDFGDCWQFEVTLERVDPPDKRKVPRILESRGKAPEQYPDAEW